MNLTLVRGELRRRVKNPLFNRISHPLPWFIVETFELKWNGTAHMPAKRIERRSFTLVQMRQIWGFGVDFLTRKPGLLMASLLGLMWENGTAPGVGAAG